MTNWLAAGNGEEIIVAGADLQIVCFKAVREEINNFSDETK